MARIAAEPNRGFFESRRGRILLENLTGYLFITPASLILLIFGLFPVAFAFYVSLHRWRRTPDGFRGLDQYVNALGDFAFVLFFWLALGTIFFGLLRLRALPTHWRGLTAIIPAAALTAATGAFINWFFTLLPLILDVPARLRGSQITQDAFLREFYLSFTFPEAASAGSLFLMLFAAAVVITLAWLWLTRQSVNTLIVAWTAGIALLGGVWCMLLTISEINQAIADALEDGTSLPVWTQIVMIGAGVALVGLALWLWQRTLHRQELNNRAFLLRALAVSLLIVGAIALIRELPAALAEADRDVLRAFNVTLMYSAFSVPLQISLGLLLAVLLFQNFRGKSLFRVIFFLPYVTPFVATSIVFSLLFSHNPSAPVNQFITALGIPPQNWLRESRGIFTLIFGQGVPDVLSGPGLALLVIIFYNVWIYAGYSAVIFLAGLGGIEHDLYEAARIDGATSWHQFRFITLPLLSPTTFFLLLVSTIGTFQAFTQIYLMRKAGGYQAVDTINLVIFNEIRRDSPNFGYGAALALVLFAVILILTFVQNRVAGRRVFYG
jgi:multiple sugar transport system permease protein